MVETEAELEQVCVFFFLHLADKGVDVLQRPHTADSCLPINHFFYRCIGPHFGGGGGFGCRGA
jgi:hypothetical protein